MIRYLKTEDEFYEIINQGTILVDFFAEWCGPCKMLGEVLEEIDADILKINTDEFPMLAQKFGVMSIPTLILFKDGSETKKLIGLQSKSDIIEFISN